MKWLIGLLAVLTASCIGTSAFAQKGTGIPGEIVQELNWIVGTWKAEGKVGDDTQTGEFACRWATTKSKLGVCLIGRFSYTTGDETRSGVTLIGWNAAKKCIEDRGFSDTGGNGTLYWFIESDTKWRGEIIRVVDGETIKAKADLIKKGDSEIVLESESEDGEVSRVVYKKVQRKRKQKK